MNTTHNGQHSWQLICPAYRRKFDTDA